MTRTYPPAWYPDPANPRRLRRWNGSSWTADTRVPPGWVRSIALAPGPRGGRRRPRRQGASGLLWLASASMVAAAFILMGLLVRSGARDPDRIADGGFARRVNAVCAAAADEVDRSEPPPGAPEARRVGALARRFETMVATIRGLPVAPADSAAVERWLRAWDDYISAGRRRAEALDRGDREAAERANDESVAPKRAVNRFVAVNGLPDCSF